MTIEEIVHQYVHHRQTLPSRWVRKLEGKCLSVTRSGRRLATYGDGRRVRIGDEVCLDVSRPAHLERLWVGRAGQVAAPTGKQVARIGSRGQLDGCAVV